MNRKIVSVTLMGSNEKINWQQDSQKLVIKKPAQLPDWSVLGFNVLLQ